MTPDDVYAAHVELIEAVLAGVCRSHRLPPDHADEFRSWARLRLLDDDQATLRKFAGRSSLRTFLTTVVERLFLDWRNHEWGKWRPSSEARRLGSVAIELERLVLRDQTPFHEAAALVVARGLAPGADACDRVWARLPRKPRRQRASDSELETRPATSAEVDPIEDAERVERRHALLDALRRAVAGLTPADQTLVQLRYWSGVKVSQIARITGDDQKQLYRRFERLEQVLLRALEADGFSGVGDLFTGAADSGDDAQTVAGDDGLTGDTGVKRELRPSGAVKTGGVHV